MEKFIALLVAHWKSWTIRLGVIVAVLTAVAAYIPQLAPLVHAIHPSWDGYLVAGAMYIGRVVGFIKVIQTSGATPA